MKSFFAAIAAISMVAATSAAAQPLDIKPPSIEEMVSEIAHAMCGDPRDGTLRQSNLARMIPADTASGRAPCGQVALHHAMQNRHSARDINNTNSYAYYAYGCESSRRSDLRILFDGLVNQVSPQCHTYASCMMNPAMRWDHSIHACLPAD